MSEIRKAFTSRFTNGLLLELDFSHLEIYALADLSKDKTLQADLLSGKDLHGISAEMLFGKSYTLAQRKIAKQLSFQLQYGAGHKSMAERNGINPELAKAFIEKYYTRYSGVAAYHDALIATVAANRRPSTHRTKNGLPAGKSSLVTSTGRIFTFTEEDSPPWMSREEVTFSPTKAKNYPCQGYATGDIVPLVLGKLHRYLMNSGGGDLSELALMVNTTHDSVLFDCSDESVVYDWAPTAKKIMESAPSYLKERFNIDFFTPVLPVGVTVGPNWYDMHDWPAPGRAGAGARLALAKYGKDE